MFSGEKLKKIRQEKGYSQADLAKLLQLSRASYFNWENGKTKPNQKNLKQLSQIFKVDPTYFLSEHDIVNIFLKLNPDNQVKLENYAEELLKEQEIIKPLPKLYAYMEKSFSSNKQDLITMVPFMRLIGMGKPISKKFTVKKRVCVWFLLIIITLINSFHTMKIHILLEKSLETLNL